MKTFLILLLTITTVFANNLIIHSKVFPTVLQYDRDLNKKVDNDRVKFVIVYSDSFESKANEFKELISKKHKKIAKFDLDIEIISEKEVKESDIIDANGIYFFPINDKIMKYLIDYSIKNSILTFSNINEMLNQGVAIGLLTDRRIKPIINKKIIKKSKIKLNSTLLKVSKIYE